MTSSSENETHSNYIRREITRFEGVHPNIYAIYELLNDVTNEELQTQIREHVINIEDAFVNSQEWTSHRSLSEIRLGILGGVTSGKSSLVHRYLTGSYVDEESPEGGRFKRDVFVEGANHLLLLRDEGGPPEIEFCTWVDAVLLVFNLTDQTSFQTMTSYLKRLCKLRDVTNLPLIIIGSQDKIDVEHPRVISDVTAKNLTAEIRHQCFEYFEICSTYGLNVDQVFREVTRLVVLKRHRNLPIRSSSVDDNMMTSSPLHHHHASINSSYDLKTASTPTPNDISDSGSVLGGFFTPNPIRKSLRHKKSGGLFSGRKNSDAEKRNSYQAVTSPTSAKGEMGFGRSIPLKQGHVMKKSGKRLGGRSEWRKKYLVLDEDGHLSYYNHINDYMENICKQTIHVVHTTVKVPGRLSSISSPIIKSSDNCSGNFEFQIVSISGDTWHLMTSSIEQRDAWVDVIGRMYLQTVQNHKSSRSSRTDDVTLEDLINSMTCVECGAAKPTWASLNLGCLICIDCSGIHRNLGTHISRVRSLELDEWPFEYIQLLKRIGNKISNEIWNPSLRQYSPSMTSSRDDFIRDKYIKRLFIAPLSPEHHDIGNSLIEAIKADDMKTFLHLLAYIKYNDVNKQFGIEQKTLLHFAAQTGNLCFCQLLLWLNADPQILDGLGETPTNLAKRHQHFHCLQLLLTSQVTKQHQMTSSHRNIVAVTSSSSRTPRNRNLMYTSAI